MTTLAGGRPGSVGACGRARVRSRARHLVGLVAVGAAALGTGGCAGMMQPGGSGEYAFTQDLGRTTAPVLREMTEVVLRRHQFELQRIEERPAIVLETAWKAREPFKDERDMGATEAQTRIIVRGRERSVPSASYDMYVVEFAGDTMLRIDGQWSRHAPGEGVTAYLREIADELETELRSGVRVF